MVRNLLILILSWLVIDSARAAEPKSAYDLLPANTQAVIWVPSAEAIAERWNRTQLARLADDPAVRDFWQDQQQQIESKLTVAGWRLQIQPRDLEEIVQGQIALAWIEHRDDVRKPFALALIVDVVDKAAETKQFLTKLDAQLKERGSVRQQSEHQGVAIVQNTLPRHNGELLPQETYYAVANDQLLASDDLNTLKGLLDIAAAGEAAAGTTISSDAAFLSSRKELEVSGQAQAEYFVRPLGFARVLRAMSGKRGGGKADVLAVLQNQGFDAIQAVCGELKLGEEKFDIVHRGYVLSAAERSRTVQMLDFPNEVRREVPGWVPGGVSSMLANCWNIRDAFWKVEGLVDELAGQEKVFHEIIEGIKVDPTGPRIDIAKDVMPLLTNEIYSISDSKLPIDIDSSRNLIALRVTKPEQMVKILRQAMSTEPDAQEVSINGQQIWQVAHQEDDPTLNLDDDFGAFGAKPSQSQPSEQPWLSNWAITVYGEYLMFASHVELISEAIEQAKKSEPSPLESQADYRRISDALLALFGDSPACAWRVNRSELAYRPQYELFRAGKLQQSQSMLASILEHLLQNKTEIQQKKPAVDGTKLPPFDAVSKYLQPSGVTVKTTEKGWSFGAVLLSQDGDPRVNQ